MNAPAAPSHDVWTLRLARLPAASSILAAVILLPLTLLALIGGAVLRDLKLIACGAGMAIVGGRLILEALTVRLRLSQGRLWLDRYGRTQWTAARALVVLERGRIGQSSVVKGYRVLDRATGDLVGAIPFWQFRRADLDRLEALLRQDDRPPPL